MLIVNLHDSRVLSQELIGGKAASLMHLASLSVLIPNGFCITTKAYTNHLHRLLLEGKCVELLEFTDQPTLSNEMLAKLRNCIMVAELSSELKQVTSDALNELKKHCLHVPLKAVIRSSANTEDLPGASFAGQYDTYLNVVNEETIMQRIKQCWASLWSERAYLYRVKNGFDSWKTQMAVIVQELLPAEVAGTLFTANPVTGNTNETIIEASWGLGELIVSGQVTPDTYYIRTNTELPVITKKLISRKLSMLSAHPGKQEGTLEIEVPKDRITAQALPDQLILDLVRWSTIYSRHYNYPCDIEWAWCKGKVYILQIRAITSFVAQFD